MAKKLIFVLSIIFLIVLSFYLPLRVFKHDENPNVTKAAINVEKIALENLPNSQIFKLNDNYTAAFTEEKSIFIDNKTGLILSLEAILKSNYAKFNEIEEKELHNKYPDFIVEGLKISDKAYQFTNDGITIKYNNYEINPIISEKLFITLTCAHLDYLNLYECNGNKELDINKYKLDPNKPTIALTFDDGPNANTEIVINALKKNKAKATFFMLGQNMKNYSSTVKEIYDSDFEIGSHTYSHKYLTRITDEERIEELSKTNQIYKEITNDNIKLTRAPYGAINNSVRDNSNTTFIQWSVDTEDWRHKDSEYIANYIVDNVKDGDIVLCHDIHATTGRAIELALPLLYAKGYQVTTVSDLAKLNGKTIEINKVYTNFR